MKIDKSKVIAMDGKYYVKSNIILASSTSLQRGDIVIENGKLRIAESLSKDLLNTKAKPHHLYFIVDELIEEGTDCWALNPNTKYLKEHLKYYTTDSKGIKYANGYRLADWKKIIASTNELLDWDTISTKSLLPRPSEQFIRRFIKSCNIIGVANIDSSNYVNALVECTFELSNNENEAGNLIPEFYLKLDANGYIIVKIQLDTQEQTYKPNIDIIKMAISKGCECSNNGRYLQDIQAWLRDEHDIHVQPIIHSWSNRTYQFRIHSDLIYVNSMNYKNTPIIGTHDYALEMGLIIAMESVPTL